MKKIVLLIIYLLSVLLLVGTYVVHYFTKAKMGMARYMVYFNGKIDNALGGFGRGRQLLLVLIILISIVTVCFIVITFKNLKGSLINKIHADIACVINAFSLFYVVAFNRDKARDYYLNSMVYVAVGVLLIIAMAVNLRGRNEDK